MIGQAFIEDTVIHANGRQNQDWLEVNHLPECSDMFSKFCMLSCYCGHINFRYEMCQIIDGTLTGYGNLINLMDILPIAINEVTNSVYTHTESSYPTTSS